jgi:hypothetical protein
MFGRILTAAGLIAFAAGASTASAQRSHFGFHGGYNTEMEHGALGVQMQFPISSAIEFYPSFDYYLVDGGTQLGWNGDIKFQAAGAPLYFGGGLNLLTGGGNSDAGFNLIGGLETRYGETHPYVEVRGLFHGDTSLQLLMGLNFTLH